MSIKQPQDRYIKVGDINTRYRAVGDKGTNVVLVHGLGGFIENWVKNIDFLAEHHRVYAFDLAGFGRSDKTPLMHDFNTIGKFINDFVTLMGIEKASFIGNSLGGGLALQFALEHPEKVEKLVLADNAGMGRGVISIFKFCSLPALGELIIGPSLKRTEFLWKKIVYDKALVTPELVKLSYGMINQPGAKESFLATLRAGINWRGQRDQLTQSLLDRLGTIKAPVMVVWGKNDRIIPASHAQIAVEKIPGARLVMYDKCGHMPQFEHPEEFNKLTRDFLAE